MVAAGGGGVALIHVAQVGMAVAAVLRPDGEDSGRQALNPGDGSVQRAGTVTGNPVGKVLTL